MKIFLTFNKLFVIQEYYLAYLPITDLSSLIKIFLNVDLKKMCSTLDNI